MLTSKPVNAQALSEQNNNNETNSQDDRPRKASIQSGHSSLTSSGSSASSDGSNTSNKMLSSNADYDHIRNTTLMFFLDRLYIAAKDGQEARTLHDLSCLFGTKDFTKEMRQIVGASRNGLKKFLQSYPSLFTIDGEKVYLSQLKQDQSQSNVRDYNKEAVDYFRTKLLQFGTSLVPIRNLFGYRSQASQEVRHVSGKNTKEFKQFLLANSDVFKLLAQEHVVLKSVLEELKAEGKLDSLLSLAATSSGFSSANASQDASVPADNDSVEKSSIVEGEQLDEPTLIDPYLNKQFAHFIENCMRQGALDKITVANLHEKINKECQNQLFLKMIRTIDNLKVFLRMHPKIFKKVKCDDESGSSEEFIRLLSEEERQELEAQTYSSLSTFSRQHSTLKRCDTTETSQLNETNEPMSLPASHSPRKVSAGSEQPMSIAPSTRQQQNTKAPLKRMASNQAADSLRKAESPLRATAPPFVPSSSSSSAMTNGSPAANQRQSAKQQASNSLSSRNDNSTNNHHHHQFSNQLSSLPPQLSQPQSRNFSNSNKENLISNHQQPQSLRNNHQSIQRSYSALKTKISSSPKSGHQLVRQNSNLSAAHQQQQQQNNDLRARTVNIVREASNIITKIINTADAVAFDCKGYNLGFNGQITLIQLGYLPSSKQTGSSNQHPHRLLSELKDCRLGDQQRQKPEVCIFDLITNPELAYCLKPLLESDKIIKIVHDVRNKSNALYNQCEIMLQNVFDTQVANLVIQQQETGKPAYKSRYISMGKLCEIYGNESLNKFRHLIQSKTRHSQSASAANFSRIKDVNYWKTRPLTQAMLHESTMDVHSLIGGVYQNLRSKIKPEYEPLFDQLNLEGVLARIKPEEIRSVKKERKIDLEVIDLKRKLYSDTTNCSIVLSNREIRLLRHIDLTDEVRAKIQQCKKVAKKLERLDMKAAQLETLNNGEQSISMNTDNQDQSIVLDTSIQTETSSSTVSSSSEHKSPNQMQDDETGMSNLMDSSMFDELKDKMIESSSLLKSLEDEDDDHELEVQLSLGPTDKQHHSLEHQDGHDSGGNCHCNCHHGKSTTLSKSIVNEASRDQQLTLKEQQTDADQQSGSNQRPVEDETHKDAVAVNSLDSPSSSSSKAVDMAVQCDLLG